MEYLAITVRYNFRFVHQSSNDEKWWGEEKQEGQMVLMMDENHDYDDGDDDEDDNDVGDDAYMQHLKRYDFWQLWTAAVMDDLTLWDRCN